jgi:Uma2 family endonuclease
MATLARLSIEDYNRIVETGVFDGRRIEFIEGRICEMTPIGDNHEHAVDELTEWSVLSVANLGVRVRVQETLELHTRGSVPQPDVVWVDRAAIAAKKTRPQAEDVVLVIEVADTSLAYDLGEKAGQYAAAGIRDYWVVDCQNQRVIVHRQPSEAGYGSVAEFSGSEAVSPLSHPEVSLLPEVLFRPTNKPRMKHR